MTRYEANKILDQAREGNPCNAALTIKCLYATGDLRAFKRLRSEGVAQEEERKDWGYWVRENAIMVGRSKE